MATKGSKQIVEENAATLKFYQYMAAGSTTIFLVLIFLFFEFTGVVSVGHFGLAARDSGTHDFRHRIIPLSFQTMAFISVAILLGSYQFMAFMSKAKVSETGAILDSGNDLNIEGGIAE